MRLLSASALLSALALTLPVSARIYGISAPSTIEPGTPFTVSLLTQDYIQSVYDVAVAFGVASGQGYPDSLGTVFASEYLGPALSNTLNNINFPVIIDGNTPAGTALISASVYSLYGVEYEPTLENFNVTVTVGSATSTDTVKSQ